MNKTAKIGVIAALVLVVGVTLAVKQKNRNAAGPVAEQSAQKSAGVEAAAAGPGAGAKEKAGLPRLVDLGAGKCIPCKLMAPILEELKKEYVGRMEVVFIDVWENRDAGQQYGVQVIPTQIFFDRSGKELFRHEGFFSREDILSKWKELGVDLGGGSVPEFSRLEPLSPDARAPGTMCYLCDGDVNPRTRVAMKTDKGDVVLCSAHCYLITYSSLLDTEGIHEKVTVTDWATGKPVAAARAVYLCGMEDSGRPFIKAFADRQSAMGERAGSGGNILNWEMLQTKELAHRCGFCDRAVYPEDAGVVRADGVYTWGCCPMCALGVAARTNKDIEIFQKDALTGEMIHVGTLNGSVSLLEPKTAVAWAGTKKGPDGKPVSTGCFKQAFFANEANLRKWVEQHPTATGRMISIGQALTEKMKLSPQQIAKACKIGECVPK